MTLPEGWTDDMNIALPAERTLDEVVSIVISMSMGKSEQDETEDALIGTIGLSRDDAALAWDRVHGGIVRASTGNEANCPSKDKDPLAWLSFHRAIADNAIIVAIYPQYAEETTHHRLNPISAQRVANDTTQPRHQPSEGNTMKTRRSICRALAVSLTLPGIVCLVALFVPALHDTGFVAFSARYWWVLLFSGAILSILGIAACQFVEKARTE